MCRSVLAEALTLQLLAMHYPHLDISAQAASIGPCPTGVHEPYVQYLAQVCAALVLHLSFSVGACRSSCHHLLSAMTASAT